ncbi:hypothetical protein B0H63DRAFT_2792 [Podospora didyma]|uniref:Uncharacterized protein n=1 Tax=Podospora didyma TaxID=330526 RepID=A0AAE0P4K1_9PEZI|nr:hypothetical protein B0H63DRAFT_2792 [Podospora didyma]
MALNPWQDGGNRRATWKCFSDLVSLFLGCRVTASCQAGKRGQKLMRRLRAYALEVANGKANCVRLPIQLQARKEQAKQSPSRSQKCTPSMLNGKRTLRSPFLSPSLSLSNTDVGNRSAVYAPIPETGDHAICVWCAGSELSRCDSYCVSRLASCMGDGTNPRYLPAPPIPIHTSPPRYGILAGAWF